MSTSTKTPSSFKLTLRALELGVALGLAAFLIGTLLQSRLTFTLFGPVNRIGSPALQLLAGIVLSCVPTLIVAPLVAYAAGLYFEGSKWLLGWSIAIGTQLFPPAISGVVNGWSGLLDPLSLVTFLVSTILSGLLCGYAFGRGQRRAHDRVAAPVVQAAAGALSKIDFEAVKKAAETQPEPKAAEAAPAETPASGEPKTGT